MPPVPRAQAGSDTNISLWADGSHHISTQLLHDDEAVYIRATIRLGDPLLQPPKLFPDFQRLFVHGTGASTLSLYLHVLFSFFFFCPVICGCFRG